MTASNFIGGIIGRDLLELVVGRPIRNRLWDWHSKTEHIEPRNLPRVIFPRSQQIRVCLLHRKQ